MAKNQPDATGRSPGGGDRDQPVQEKPAESQQGQQPIEATESEAQSAAGGRGGMVPPNAKVGQDEMHPAVMEGTAAGLTPMGRTQNAIANEHNVIMQELQTDEAKALQSDSARIRWLAQKGHSRSAIAKALGKRYQHVRNVLIQPIRRTVPQQPWQGATAAGTPAQGPRPQPQGQNEPDTREEVREPERAAG